MRNKVQKILLYGFVVYAIFGFLVLPFIIKSQIIKIVEKDTYSKISIESVIFNPLIFNLKVRGITLTTLDDKPLLSLKALELDLELYSLLQSAIHIKTFILEKPEISLVLNADKSFNYSSIMKKTQINEQADKNSTSIQIPRIILDRVAVVDGDVNYEDYTHQNKFDFSFAKIGFELTDVDTDDYNSSDAKLRFYSLLDDSGFVNLKSRVIGFQPFRILGSLDFEATKLYSEWRYIQDSLNLEVADGKMSLNTNYYLNLDDLNSTTLYNLNASIDNLRIKPKQKHKDILNLKNMSIKDAIIKPMAEEVFVKNIELDSLYVKAKRDTKGNVDWQKYIKINSASRIANTEQNSSSNTKEISAPWNVVIDAVSFQKIKVDFADNGLNPSVNTKINELNISVQNLTLAGIESLRYQMGVKINETLQCNFHGDVKHKILELQSYTQCSGVNLAHYKPYIDQFAKKELRVYDLKLTSAIVGFDANVSVNDQKSQTEVNVNNGNFNINKLAIDKRGTAERVLGFDRLYLNGVSLNTKNKNITIQKTALHSLYVNTARSIDGSLNIQDLIVLKEKKSGGISKPTFKKKEKEYRIVLKHFALNSAKLGFDDQTLSPSIKSTIDEINLNAYNIDSAKDSWLQYDLSLRINGAGYAKSRGSISHSPLMQKGAFELNKISLKELNPYIGEKVFLRIDDGYLSMKSNTEYVQSSKAPDLKVDGSFNLQEFFLSDSRDNTSLASVSEVGLKSFTFEMFPNRLFIDEVNVDSFYVNAIIDRNKSINFSSLVKKRETNEVLAKDTNRTDTKEVFPVKIAKLNVSMGSARFVDLSLPLKFRTYIHDLNGVVYSISNLKEDTSYVDIAGEVDEYGSTKLLGSINSGNPKAYTDLDFNFKNLELKSLSGYSASFAGHKIDSGKLYLDLGYKVLNSELVGKNSIIVKNIKVGDEFKTKNGNSLPLGFVVGLLEDNEGVIDINMPVEGNVDKPNFKYATLLRETLSNLILKAATSPFQFFGSLIAGVNPDTLEYVEFEYAKVDILPPEREKLDNIAKIMNARPKISLSISGSYDENMDKMELQKKKLITLLAQKSGIKNLENRESAMNIDLLEDIYEDVRDDNRLDEIKNELKKRYKDEVFDRVYLSALITECTKNQLIPIDVLRKLATQRANAIKAYLVNEKNISSSRIKLIDINRVQKQDDKFVKTQLAIEVK